MAIQHLEVSGIRNLQTVVIEPSSKFNLIVGPNGSGKSSLLEAITMLSSGRSFRTNRYKKVISEREKTATVFALVNSGEVPCRAGILKHRVGTTQIKINGVIQNSQAELSRLFPSQILHPESVSLVDGGPKERRQYLDWGVFHVEQLFLELWRNAQKALKQRNSLLRSGKVLVQQIKAWDDQLVSLGEAIHLHRQSYFEALVPVFLDLQERFGTGEPVSLSYYRGWRGEDYASMLEQSFGRDQETGRTSCGPHRADIRIMNTTGAFASDVLSRGQKKLLTALLKLSQTKLHINSEGSGCVVLLDDLPSEMDIPAREMVCRLLDEFDCQVFLTCIQEEALAPYLTKSETRVFHVEQGKVSESS